MLFHRILALAATKLVGRATQMDSFLATSQAEDGVYEDDFLATSQAEDGVYEDDDMLFQIVDGLDLEECGIVIDLASAMMGDAYAATTDPTKMLDQLKLSPPCNQGQTQMMRTKLVNFETCSGYDILELDEDMVSSVMGAVMRCASEVTLSDIGEFNVPEACMEAFFGNHPLGKMLRDVLFHPGNTSECFRSLGENIPQCTLDLWPFPIDGKAIRQASCVNDKLEGLIISMCTEMLDSLACLPPADKLIAGDCSTYVASCADMESAPLVQALFMLPSGMRGMPLPDQCQTAAGKQDLVQRYDTYRTMCWPKDTKLWNRLEEQDGPMQMTTFYEFMHPDGTKEGSVSIEKVNEEAGLGGIQSQETTTASGGGGSFGYGVLAGFVLAGVAYMAALYVIRKRQTAKFSTIGQLELSETTEGDFS